MSPPSSALDLDKSVDAILLDLQNSESAIVNTSSSLLDALSDKLASALSIVRGIRNARTSPICKLPPETLVVIFQYLQTHPTEPVPNCEELAVMQVTHVCRLWRQTALDSPSLWSLISGVSEKAALAYLARSQQAPLRVYLSSPAILSVGIQDSIFMDALVLQTARIRDLKVPIPHEYDESILHYFHFPAPNLEHLDISVHSYDNITPTLPTLFDGVTPALRRLTIRHFTSWPGNNFVNLTHFSSKHQDLVSRPNTTQFLNFLDACPNMEEIILIQAGPASLGPTHHLVTLNSLHTIAMGWMAADQVTRTILENLVIPKTAEIFVWGSGIVFDQNDISTLYLAHMCQESEPRDITELRITHTGRNPETLVITEELVQFDGFLSPSLGADLIAIPQVETFVSVTELWLSDTYELYIAAGAWEEFFMCLPALTKLVISRTNAEPVISCLSSTHNNGNNGPLCPKLQSLHIFDDYLLSAMNLFVLAEQRSACNIPIKELHVRVGASVVYTNLGTDLMTLKRFIESVTYETNCDSNMYGDGLVYINPTMGED